MSLVPCIPAQAWWLGSSPFAAHVRNVVRVRAEHEMDRVTARRVVADMQDMQTIRDGGAIGNLPRKPMRPYNPLSIPQLTITMVVPSTHPWPTRICTSRLVDARPEAFDCCGTYHPNVAPRIQSAIYRLL
jgi:hypothetical protein